MTLGWNFGSSGISGAATLEAILIGIANIGAGPKSGFGLHVNSLLYEFFKAIELSTALLHFGSD